MRTISCNSAYGPGGLGQHFAQLVEETRESGNLQRYIAPTVRSDDPLGHVVTIPEWQKWIVKYTPLRYTPSWRNFLLGDLYDRRAAHALPPSGDRFMGFVGKALHSFRAARERGFRILELVAANSHVRNVQRLHQRAAADSGVSDSWLNEAQAAKTIREYELADRILVHSRYTADSFLEAGIPSAKLHRTYLRVHPRFQPPDDRPDDELFRIVYVGRIEATKGIGVLLDAYERLDVPSKELTLVGGWSTRSMRKYMTRRLSDVRNVELAPGDPLPSLQTADVFIHPSYEDGFGYAPMEALACGVPVIVTEDTGMKEYVIDGQNGFVVPTGSVDHLLHRLGQITHKPMACTESLLPSTYYEQVTSVPVAEEVHV